MASHCPGFRIGVTLVLGLAIASCNNRSPTAPPQPATGNSPLVRLEITAPPSIEPGESVRLTARTVRANGATQDVTNQARWSTNQSAIVQSGSGGHITGLRVGEATILVTYDDASRTLVASTAVLVLSRGTYKISGRVTESGAAILNATVTVLSGVGAGLTTVTVFDGRFAFYGVSGPIALEARRDGYLLKVEQVHISATVTHDIEMVPDRQRSDLSGNYILTLEAGACSENFNGMLRDDLRRRVYKANVAQQGPRVVVTLTDADFIVENGRGNRFTGVVDPLDTVRFEIGIDTDGYVFIDGVDLVERVDSTTAFLVFGTVNARPAPSGIVGTLSGSFSTAPPGQPYSWSSVTSCYSTGHVFTMRRQ
jgi:hypothetical protein